MRLIVLGAGGFVGRRIVGQAAARFGAEAVIAGVRRPTGGEIFPAGVAQRVFDGEVADSVCHACEDATHIVNCVMGSRRAMVESCHGAVQAIAGDASRKLVHFSSIAVFGDRRGVVAEADTPGPPIDAYAAAKIEAERIVRAAPSDHWTILRPGLVHGPGSELWTRRIARLVGSGRLGPLGPLGEGICNLVAADDVVAAALAACGSAEADGRAIALVADDPPSWNRYLEDMAEALGLLPRPISPARLRAERYLAYPLTLMERLRLPAPAAVTPGLFRLFGQNVRFASSAVPTLLPAWRDYPTALAEGARWTMEGDRFRTD